MTTANVINLFFYNSLFTKHILKSIKRYQFSQVLFSNPIHDDVLHNSALLIFLMYLSVLSSAFNQYK